MKILDHLEFLTYTDYDIYANIIFIELNNDCHWLHISQERLICVLLYGRIAKNILTFTNKKLSREIVNFIKILMQLYKEFGTIVLQFGKVDLLSNVSKVDFWKIG